MAKSKSPALPPEALSVFCAQIALMLRAGIGSEEAVAAMAEDADPASRALLERLQAVLLEGRPLSGALEECGTFPDYLVRMVEIGQAAGRLDQVLSALSAYYRREAETAAALRRAVVYPAVMAVLVAVVFVVLVARVLPVFQQVFDQLGVSFSPAARTLLQAGAAGKWLGAVLVALLAAGAGALLALTRPGSAGANQLLRRGRAGAAVDRSRFASAMALMLSSGLPLDEAMDRTVRLLEGAALFHRLEECRGRMERGEDFYKAVSGCGILGGMEAGLLGAGFRAGVPERAMEELAARCQEEADARLGELLSKLEFGLITILCAAVGLVLLSVMLPLLGVLAAIG